MNFDPKDFYPSTIMIDNVEKKIQTIISKPLPNLSKILEATEKIE